MRPRASRGPARWLAVLVAALVLLAGCEKEARPARVLYNQAASALAKGELDEASAGFLKALNQAGFDDDLRFRANFNLAAVAARRAEAALAAQPRDVDGALDAYRRAMSWLGDASRIRPDDADTRANLERVQARMLAIVDEANRGKNGLEHRLDEAIEAERALRDAARKLWAAQDARGAGADPLADRDVFEAAAARQRELGTDTGVIADLAGDEITAIGGKAEDQRTDEEKVRLVELQNLDLYIQDARKEMVDARRNLHDLRGELAHGRTEAALAALKRAREQLLDPVAVLQGVAQDQLQTAQLTAALDELGRGGRFGQAGAPPPPAWLTTTTLGGDQRELRARLEEVKARFAAGLQASDATPGSGTGTGTGTGTGDDPQAAERARVKALVAEAMPSIDEAAAAMTRAGDALAASDAAKALAAQRDALIAMSRAIELFLPLRKLVDVTLAEQRQIVAALTPPAEGAAAMPAAERAKIVGEGATRNRDRLLRMQGLIAAEKERAAAEAAAAAQQQGQAGGAAPDPAQATALQDRLEALRVEAAAAIDELAKVAAGGKGAPALESAKAAEAKLLEMQKLLFSVIEHLRELVREQGETRDQTAKMELEDDAGRVPLLPGILQRQGEHAELADAIAQALAQQADAAAQAGQGGGAPAAAPPGQPSPQAFAEAAGEVRNGRTSMQGAADTLTKARESAGTMSYNLQPVLEDQQQAKEHLENALRLLTPPQQQQGGEQDQQKQDQQEQDQQQQDQQQKQDQQQQDQQKQDQQKQDQQQQDQQQQDQQQQQQSPDQQQSADEAERRLQRVREREAQRQREQQERQRYANEPVERDW